MERRIGRVNTWAQHHAALAITGIAEKQNDRILPPCAQ
jgi:hypothetical protein